MQFFDINTNADVNSGMVVVTHGSTFTAEDLYALYGITLDYTHAGMDFSEWQQIREQIKETRGTVDFDMNLVYCSSKTDRPVRVYVDRNKYIQYLLDQLTKVKTVPFTLVDILVSHGVPEDTAYDIATCPYAARGIASEINAVGISIGKKRNGYFKVTKRAPKPKTELTKGQISKLHNALCTHGAAIVSKQYGTNLKFDDCNRITHGNKRLVLRKLGVTFEAIMQHVDRLNSLKVKLVTETGSVSTVEELLTSCPHRACYFSRVLHSMPEHLRDVNEMLKAWWDDKDAQPVVSK